MAKMLSEIGEDMITIMSETVNGGDGKVKADPNNFVTWCMPGLPFEAADFEFCAKGYGAAETAEEDKRLMAQAYALATLVDFVPDPTAAFAADRQDRVWRTSQARMSHMYGEILRQSKVADETMTPAALKQLDRLRGMLKRSKMNPITEVEMLVDSAILEAYNQHMSEYIAAKMEYNFKRITAASARGPEGKAATQDFFLNAALYQMKATNALRRWESLGFKNDVEEIFARINDLTGRSAKVWKQKLLDAYEESKVRAMGPGQEFFYTTLLPGNFATSGGWQEHKQTHSTTTSTIRKTAKSWNANAGYLGAFSVGGSATGSTTNTSSDISVENFTLSFQFTQVVIARPFFFPEFFMHRGWTLEKGKGWMFDDLPSDGASPPKGLFIGYPTTVLLARNIVIESTEIASHLTEFKKTLGAKAKMSVLGFGASGGYAKSEEGRDFEAKVDGAKITIPGMQIIGFVNRLIGKAPNPFPGLVFDEPEDPAAEPVPGAAPAPAPIPA